MAISGHTDDLRRRRPRRAAAAAFTLTFLFLLSGCYVLKQGTRLLSYELRAEDIERVLADPATTPEVRRLLELVRDVRRFGVAEIGLSEDRNYTTYVSIDKDHLVDVVSATADDSFRRHTWWFPIVGRVPYKGFYDPKDAERLAAKLKKQSLDVIIRPVDAFSTLGFFRDPVYSFMKSYPVFEVASLVLHEETHAALYLKNQAQFNEELASFVGNEGALLYMRKRYGEDSELYTKTLLEQHDDQAFTEYLKGIHARLEAVYASDLDRAAKLAAKQRILDDERDRFAQDYSTRFRTERYRGFSKARINNAYLDLYATYTQDLGVFERLYEKDGRDLRRMMEQMRQLKDFKGDAKEHIRTALLGEPAGEGR